MKTIQTIKCLPIRAYLAERGLHPTKDNPRYGLYLSPLRKEQTPSFKVDYTQNLWYDFGLGVGGSIIDLVMRLEKCDSHKPFDCSAAVREHRSSFPHRHRVLRPSPRSAFSPIYRSVIRHWSDIFHHGESIRQFLPPIAARYIMLSANASISQSGFGTMPEAGNCAQSDSRVAHRPNTLRRSTTVPIRQSHSRGLWIFSPTFL